MGDRREGGFPQPQANYDNEFKVETRCWQRLPRKQHLKQLVPIPGAKMGSRKGSQRGKPPRKAGAHLSSRETDPGWRVSDAGPGPLSA